MSEPRISTEDHMEYLSTTLKLPVKTIKTIVKGYTDLLTSELMMGMEARLGYLAQIVPEVKTNTYLATTGYEAKVLSESIGVPYTTCLTVISTYLDYGVDLLKQGKVFNLNGIITFRMKEDKEKGVTTLNSSISRSITSLLNTRGIKVRVRFNINLRHIINNKDLVYGR